jgi:riboflavin-specific deaminase-like protein
MMRGAMDIGPGPARDAATERRWQALLQGVPGADEHWPLYRPLLAGFAAPGPDGCYVLGRIAQTLDGRIATRSGASFWISGPDDILHTHRLRALFDVVLVGAGTVHADDPLLTTRLCAGASPVRVVLDTNRRLQPQHRVFQDGKATLVMVADDVPGPSGIGGAEVIAVPRNGAGLDLAAVLARLAARGLRRVFVEGGGVTVSRFLASGLLDRLHVTLAPLLLGDGIPAFTLPGCGEPGDGLRLDWQPHRLGADMLFDIALHRARPAACR